MKEETPSGFKHCCLGVAQEVALRAGHLPAKDIYWGMTSAIERSIAVEFYGLEPGMFNNYPVEVDAGSVLDPRPTNVAILNDSMGWTFNQIADAVERTFDLLTYDEIFDPSFVPDNETVAT
jgi:hypothetical protein